MRAPAPPEPSRPAAKRSAGAAKKDSAGQDDASPSQLKKFADDNRHFSLVRCVLRGREAIIPVLLSASCPDTAHCTQLTRRSNFKLADLVTIVRGRVA